MNPRPPHHLTSSDNPRIKAIVRLGEHRHRRQEGLLVVESVRQLTRALGAGLRLRELMWCADMLDPDSLSFVERVHQRAFADDRDYRGCTVNEALIHKMIGRENPDGLAGVLEQPKWSLEAVLSKVAAGGMCLVGSGIEKPGNLGAMARSASAAGAAGLIVADGVVDAFNPNAIRASTGAVFRLPIVGGTTDELIPALRERSIRVFAATPEAEQSLYGKDLTGPVAFVIGSESDGLDRRWRDSASGVTPVSIPMQGGGVDSLNASSAAAVLLFEAVRVRLTGHG